MKNEREEQQQETLGWYYQIRQSLKGIDVSNITPPVYPWADDESLLEEAPLTNQPQRKGEVLVRKLHPDTDPIIDDEEVAASVRLFDDPGVAIMLLVGHRKLRTARSITDYINSFSPEGEQIIGRKTVRKHLNRLAEAGAITRTVTDQNRNEHHFSVDECQGLYLSQAGYLANLSVQYPVTLRELFGEAEPPRGEKRYHNDSLTYTMDRIKVIRLLNDARRENGASSSVPLTANYIAEQLGVSYQRAAMHLQALQGVNVVDYQSVNSANGSYQKYRRDTSVGLGRTSSELQRTILDFVESHPEGVSTYLASVYTLSQLPEEQRQVSDAEWRKHYDQVRKCMYNLRKQKALIPVGPISRDTKMTLSITSRDRQLQLIRDTVTSLFDVKKDDKKTEEIGRSTGARITRSTGDFSVLAQKILKENREYRERRTDRNKPEEVVLFERQ